MSHSSKSPYEIRLNALELARVTLSEQYAAEAAKEQIDGNKENPLAVTRAPTPDEVIIAATKFNNFISTSANDK